jgi:hypothetical protein
MVNIFQINSTPSWMRDFLSFAMGKKDPISIIGRNFVSGNSFPTRTLPYFNTKFHTRVSTGRVMTSLRKRYFNSLQDVEESILSSAITVRNICAAACVVTFWQKSGIVFRN